MEIDSIQIVRCPWWMPLWIFWRVPSFVIKRMHNELDDFDGDYDAWIHSTESINAEGD